MDRKEVEKLFGDSVQLSGDFSEEDLKLLADVKSRPKLQLKLSMVKTAATKKVAFNPLKAIKDFVVKKPVASGLLGSAVAATTTLPFLLGDDEPEVSDEEAVKLLRMLIENPQAMMQPQALMTDDATYYVSPDMSNDLLNIEQMPKVGAAATPETDDGFFGVDLGETYREASPAIAPAVLGLLGAAYGFKKLKGLQSPISKFFKGFGTRLKGFAQPGRVGLSSLKKYEGDVASGALKTMKQQRNAFKPVLMEAKDKYQRGLLSAEDYSSIIEQSAAMTSKGTGSAVLDALGDYVKEAPAKNLALGGGAALTGLSLLSDKGSGDGLKLTLGG